MGKGQGRVSGVDYHSYRSVSLILMPNYLFQNGNQIHEVFFHMNDAKVYNGPNGDQPNQWKRVWTKPQASIDTKVDPYSSKDFVKATNKKGTVGDLWDRSKELSQVRADKDGLDPVRQQYFKNFSKRRHGKKHPEQQRQDSVVELKKAGITVDWGSDD